MWPDIGDVHHVRDLVTIEAERPGKQIFKQKRAEVADVREVVHGRPAGIHPDFARRFGREKLAGARQRVVQKNIHSRFYYSRICSRLGRI